MDYLRNMDDVPSNYRVEWEERGELFGYPCPRCRQLCSNAIPLRHYTVYGCCRLHWFAEGEYWGRMNERRQRSAILEHYPDWHPTVVQHWITGDVVMPVLTCSRSLVRQATCLDPKGRRPYLIELGFSENITLADIESLIEVCRWQVGRGLREG